MALEKIKHQFLECAINHHSAIAEGDSKRANKLHQKIVKIYNQAKIIGKQDVFLEFLNNDNEGVRLWAATASLKSNTNLALNCLNDLAQLSTITSVYAKLILALWEKGELELL